jgi:hypothetical protein
VLCGTVRLLDLCELDDSPLSKHKGNSPYWTYGAKGNDSHAQHATVMIGVIRGTAIIADIFTDIFSSRIYEIDSGMYSVAGRRQIAIIERDFETV